MASASNARRYLATAANQIIFSLANEQWSKPAENANDSIVSLKAVLEAFVWRAPIQDIGCTGNATSTDAVEELGNNYLSDAGCRSSSVWGGKGVVGASTLAILQRLEDAGNERILAASIACEVESAGQCKHEAHGAIPYFKRA